VHPQAVEEVNFLMKFLLGGRVRGWGDEFSSFSVYRPIYSDD